MSFFRKAIDADYEQIRSLLVGEPTVVVPESLHGSCWFVLEQAGRVVACGAFVCEGPEAVIHGFVVEPSQRLKGLGSDLMCGLLGQARMLGLSRARTMTHCWELLVNHGFFLTRRDIQSELKNTPASYLPTFSALKDVVIEL